MGRSLGRTVGIGTLALAVIAAGGAGVAAQGDAHAPAAAMTVADERRVHIEGTRIISMSPDGRSLVAARPALDFTRGELCVFDIETLAERSCADLSGLDAGLRIADVTWSPDSRFLAFAERAFELYFDGDLWLMDAETGALTNLLDDGFTGKLPILSSDPAKGTITVPVNPAFSPDGRTIAFSRTFITDGVTAGNDIAIVPVEGGEAQRIVSVTRDTPGVVYYGIRWAPDGSKLYLSVHFQKVEDPRNGVWVVNADGTGQRQVIGQYQERSVAPAVLQVAADGEHLLVHDPSTYAVDAADVPVFATVDVALREPTPLVPLSPDAPGYASIWVGFSPDGGALVTLQRPVETAVVALRDVGGIEEHPLPLDLQGDDGPVLLGPIDRGLAPTWTADGRLFLTGGGDFSSGTLLTIEGSAAAP